MKIFSRAIVLIWVVLGLLHSSFKKIPDDLACNADPVINSTATVTGILTTSATLGGNITSDGGAGCSLDDRGVYWDTSSPATAGTKVSQGGTSTGVFAFSVGSLPAGSHIFFVAYATNPHGEVTTSESSFYTHSLQPSAYSTPLTAAQLSSTSVQLSFPSPSSASISGYIVLRRTASDPTTTGVNDGAVASGATHYLGDVNTNVTTYTDNSVTAGTNYHYTILPYNWDGANAGTYNYLTSAGFPIATITTCAPANVTGVSAVAGDSQAKISWTNDSCQDEVMIVVSSGAISTAAAGDGSGYTADLDFSSGSSSVYDAGKVVYKGSTSPQTVINLSNGTTYNVKIFTRKLSEWSAGASTTVAPCAPDNVTALAATVSSGSLNLTWTGPTCGDEVMIVASTVAFTGAIPTGDGTGYTADNDFNAGSGTAFDGGKVVYKGLSSGQNVVNLTNGTPYFFIVFTRKLTDWSAGATISASPCAPDNVTSAVANAGNTDAFVTWSGPTCFDAVMIVVKSTAFTAAVPTGDGSAYTADSDFGGAGTVFDGGKVVFKGSGSGQAVTNLVNGTAYNFKIFTRKGTSWSAGVVITDTPCVPTNVTGATAVAGNADAIITWTTATCGDAVMIVASTSAFTATAPTGDGSLYTADPDFNAGAGTAFDGGKVVFKGSASPQTIVNLTNGVLHNFKIFTRKGTWWSAGVVVSDTPCVPTNVTALAGLDDNSNQALINWTAPTCGTQVLVVVSTSAFTAAVPTGDGSAYTGVLNFAGAGTAFDGGKVVYKGFASGQTVTNLVNGTSYNVKVFTRKGLYWSNGATTTFLQGPPTVSTLSPINTATNVSTNQTLVITFTENVKVSVTAPAANSDKVILNPGAITIDRSAITFTGNQASIPVPGTLLNSQAYDIVVGANVAADLNNNDFAGIATTNWTITTNAGATVTAPSIGACVGLFAPVGSIVITEAVANNIGGVNSSSRTLVLKFDNPGFQFKPGTTGVVATGSGDITSITTNSVTFTTATFTINFDASANDEVEAITITGLKVSPDGSASPGHIIKDATSTLAIEGVANNSTFLTTITNSAAPGAPTTPVFSTGNGTICKNTDISAYSVSVTGSNINWYSDALLTTLVASGSSINLTGGGSTMNINSAVTGTTTFYATQTTGCESPSLSVSVTIAPLPSADAGTDLTGGGAVCAGQSVILGGTPTLSVPSVPGGYTYLWTSTDGAFVDPGSVPNPSINVPNPVTLTSYDYTVLITDVNSCTGTDTKTIDVNAAQLISLTSPGSLTFGVSAPAQTLTASVPGGIFSGIGVVQTGPTTFKFDPASAYDPLSPLPQQFQISYVVTVGGCTISYLAPGNPIATITLSDKMFDNVVDQYCGSEHPAYTGVGSTGPFSLSAKLSVYNDIISNVNYWNDFNRFYYFPLYNYPYWSGGLYFPGDKVRYGNEAYTCLNANAGIPPLGNPVYWAIDNTLKVSFTGTIRNYYEGAYGGNASGPTIVQQPSTYSVGGSGPLNYYELLTNINYNACQTCGYTYPVFFMDFINPADVDLIMQTWQNFNYYYPGDVVLFAGHYYKQNLSYSFFPYWSYNEQPNLYPGVWQDMGTSFDAGYLYRQGGKAGYALFGQFVTINQTPIVSINGLLDGSNVCQVDVAGGGFNINLKGVPPTGYPLSGIIEISYDAGATFLVDGPSGNGISSVGINSGIANLKTDNAWTAASTEVGGGSYAWNGGASYNLNQNVNYSGKVYRSLQNGNFSNQPDISPTFWEEGSLNVLIRFTFDPGTTGSAPSIHCTGSNTISINLHDAPQVVFNGPTPANGSFFCFNDPSATLRTSKSAILPTSVFFNGLGVVDNLNGTAQFIPSVANPSGNAQINNQVSAVYTDIYGCQQKINHTFKVNPKITAALATPSSTYCNEDTPFSMSGNAESFTIGGPTVNATGDFVINYRAIGTNLPASTAPTAGTAYNFDPNALYAISFGATNNSTQLFQVVYTETLTGAGVGTTCTNSVAVNYQVKAPIILDIPNINGNPVICNNDPNTISIALTAITNNIITVPGNIPGAGNFSLDDDNDFTAVNGALNGTVSTSLGIATINMNNAYNTSANPGPIKQIYIEYAYTGVGCTGPATVVKPIRISDKPSLGFIAPTPADNSFFCYDGVAANLKTLQTTGVSLFGYGVIDTGGGTASFTPKSAFDASVAAGGNGSLNQTNTVKAIVQDVNGCRNFAVNTYRVNKLPDAYFNVTQPGQSTVNAVPIIGGVPSPITQNLCYSDPTFTAVQGNVNNSWFTIVYEGTTTPVNYTKNLGSFASPHDTIQFYPNRYFDESVNKGASSSNSTVYDVIYSVKDADGCINTLPAVTFNVAPKINVDFTGLNDGDTYCSNAPPAGALAVNFAPFPPANQRTFTIDGNIVALASATFNFHSTYTKVGGTFVLNYSVTSGVGGNCNFSKQKTINVLPSPTADFNNPAFPTPSPTVTAGCIGLPFAFNYTAVTSPNLPAQNPVYTFTFDDGEGPLNGPTVLPGPNASNAYPLASFYNPKLKVDYLNGCTETITKSQFIGAFPKPDFTVSDICDGDQTKFTASNDPTAVAIFDYQWDFGDGTVTGAAIAGTPLPPIPLSTFDKPIHAFTFQLAPWNVTLTARTSAANGQCPASITKAVNILKFLTPLPNPSAFYKMTQNNGGDGFFVKEDINGVSKWTFGLADPVAPVPPGGSPKAWNNNSGYNRNDQSYVNSPCFNLSSFNRPLVDIEYFTGVRAQIDGTALQYSIDGGASWVTLGNIGTGLEWYDLVAISGHPGGITFNPQSLAWSRTADTQWHEGRHSLSEILPANRTKVRFRVAFGSDPSSLAITGKGFAFKEFKIEERNRIVLAENYTNNTMANSGANNTDFAAFETTNILELVKLQYHAGLPNGDNINKQNSADPNGRAGFYGLTNNTIPKGFIDGMISQGNFIGALTPAQIAAAILPKTWANTNFELRSLSPSPIDFYNINHILQMSVLPPATGDNNKVAVSASFEVISPITTGHLAFFIAIVEKSVGSNSYVVRKLLPDASGSPITLPLNTGQVINFKPTPWEVKNFTNINQMGVVAFVQDIVTKEVIQAAFLDNPTNLPTVTTGLEVDLVKTITVYPNPADRDMTVRLPEAAAQAMPIQIIDQVGKTVHEAAFREGEREKVISTRDFAPGIYILEIDGGNGNITRKKVMVVH